MTYEKGNRADGKHYWLTPPELMEKVVEELGPDFFDPAPFPKPEEFNGLESDWKDKNYVNPPFGGFKSKTGKRMPGVTAWARKAIEEFKKGKKIVFVYPMDKWVLMMIAAGAQIKNMGDVKWLATEDHSPGKGVGRHIAMFILDPDKMNNSKDKAIVFCCKECGGIIMALVNNAKHLKDSVRSIADAIRQGYPLDLIPSEDVRSADKWCTCDECDEDE